MPECTTDTERSEDAQLRSGSALLGIDLDGNPDWSVELATDGTITRYEQVRIISSARARKLRKRGERVFWWDQYHAFCWRMWRDA